MVNHIKSHIQDKVNVNIGIIIIIIIKKYIHFLNMF